MTTQIADLIGLSEIAELYGVTRDVASGWTRKHGAPQPVATFRMGPVWDRNQWLTYKPIEPATVLIESVACSNCGRATEKGGPIEPKLIFASLVDPEPVVPANAVVARQVAPSAAELLRIEIPLYCRYCLTGTDLIIDTEGRTVQVRTSKEQE